MRRAGVPGILGVLLAAGLLLASGSAAGASAAERAADSPATDPTTVRMTFEPDPSPDIANPERGLNSVVSRFQDITRRTIDDARRRGFTLIRAYVDLSGYVDVDRLPDDLFARVDAAFALLRSNGMKAILRFSYSPGGTAACAAEGDDGAPATASDAPAHRILAHIDQLAATVHANEDVISSLEAGFLGEFGEWHCSTYNRTEPDDIHSALRQDVKQEVVDEELAAFPAALQIAIRYPRDLFALTPDVTDPSDRLGNHQDCWASNEYDSDTWDPGVVAGEKERIGLVGENHVVSGVACNGTGDTRVSCPTALREMPQMHFSYLDGDFRADALAILQAQGCWDRVTASLGYRLQLTDATLPAALVLGGSAHVTIGIDNVGWASPINPRPVLLTLASASGHVTAVRLDADPRAWKAGQHVVLDEDVAVPADLPAGEYTPGLWLPDRAEALRADPAYSIRLADLGTWDAGTGINAFPRTVHVGTTTASPGAQPTLAPTGVDRDPAVAAALAGATAATGALLVLVALRRRAR